MYILLYCKSIVVKMFLHVCYKTKRKKIRKKSNKNEKNTSKKNTTKNIIEKIQQKRERPKKEWVKGEEEPTEKIFVQSFCLNYSVFFS